MTEYISINMEPTDVPDVILIQTNLKLAPEGKEVYPDRTSGEEGSPLAQTIFNVASILALTIDGSTMTIHHNGQIEVFQLVDEVQTALTDFFL